MRAAIFLSCAALAASRAFVPAIFQDGMVLQTPSRNGAPASIFGYANPGEQVGVNMTIAGVLTQYTAVGDASTGKWSVVVAPGAGSNQTPGNVTFSIAGATDTQPIVIQNAAFGEVILCSGQSNMVLSVYGASYAIGRPGPPSAPLQNFTFPNIRLFSVITQNESTPQRDLPAFVNRNLSRCSWGYVPGIHNDVQVCQSWQTAQPGVTDYISAECFYTAYQLIQNGAISSDVTIGLVQSAYSGTAMETWIPPEALEGCPAPPQRPEPPHAADADAQALGAIPNEPFCLWNSMIYPIVGYGLRAVLWNQIESNMGDSFEYYACVFQNQIASWRARWGIGPFAFLSTQLGDQGFVWPAYVMAPRDAQLAVFPNRYPGVSRTPAAGVVTAYDKGDRVDNPFGTYNVHSRYKQEIGRRMALLLQNVTALTPTPDWNGPTPLRATAGAGGAVTLTWAAPGAVYANGTNDCWECCDGSQALDVFQLSYRFAGANETNGQPWVNTTWSFNAGSAAVTITPVAAPPNGQTFVVLRYAASLWPQCAFYSATNDVPALSFSDANITAAAA